LDISPRSGHPSLLWAKSSDIIQRVHHSRFKVFENSCLFMPSSKPLGKASFCQFFQTSVSNPVGHWLSQGKSFTGIPAIRVARFSLRSNSVFALLRRDKSLRWGARTSTRTATRTNYNLTARTTFPDRAARGRQGYPSDCPTSIARHQNQSAPPPDK